MKYTPAGVDQRDDVRRGANFIISGLTCGHGVFHWIMQSFLVMLPEVQAAFSLTGVGVGGIATTREMVSGIVTLPGGVIVDMLRRYWGLVLAVCMGGFGLGWLVIGVSPVYPLLLVGTGLMAMAASIWHLPATAALSHHFAHRRGTALSFHGIGGNIGDVVGPVTTGALLAVLSWREILSIYAAVPLFLAFAVYWAFKDIGRSGDQYGQAPDLGDHIAMTRTVLRNRALWGITLVAGLRGMAFVALMTFLPLYLDDELGMSVVSRGLHIGLLVAIGGDVALVVNSIAEPDWPTPVLADDSHSLQLERFHETGHELHMPA